MASKPYLVNPSTSEVINSEDGEIVATATSIEMAIRICNALNHQAEVETHEKIAIIWKIDDVRRACRMKEIGVVFSDDQCREVLRRTRHYHDASLGISWNTLAFHATDVLEGR